MPGVARMWSQGKTEAEALTNIKEAIIAWLWAEDQKAAGAWTQKAGSHPIVNLSIPQHRELSVGTLRALIRNAGMTVEEFLDLL